MSKLRILETFIVFFHHLAVHGGWSEWDEYGSCTLECGGGTETRTRECSNPMPLYGGDDCVGELSETKSCNEQNCRNCYFNSHL